MLIKNFYKTILTIPDMEVNLASEQSIDLECQLIDYNGNPVVGEEVTIYIEDLDEFTGQTNQEGKFSITYDCSTLDGGYYNVHANEATGYFRVLFVSGWQTLSLASGYSTYTSGQNILSCRRIEDVVEVRGVLRRSGSVSANSNWKQVATLPEGYRPHKATERPQQGSEENRVAWQIDPSGGLKWRYYGTTSSIAMPDQAWLNIFFNFFI